jgi:hypothetical protein
LAHRHERKARAGNPSAASIVNLSCMGLTSLFMDGGVQRGTHETLSALAFVAHCGRQNMTPADLRLLHKYMLEIETVSRLR